MSSHGMLKFDFSSSDSESESSYWGLMLVLSFVVVACFLYLLEASMFKETDVFYNCLLSFFCLGVSFVPVFCVLVGG